MFADVAAGAVLIAGAVACVIAVALHPSGRLPRLVFAAALACAAAFELSEDAGPAIVAVGLGALALLALVVERSPEVSVLSWLDGVMGATAAAALTAALGGDAAAAGAAGACIGALALGRWRPSPAVLAAVAGVAALGAGEVIAPVAAIGFVAAAWVREPRKEAGPDFSPVVLAALLSFAIAALALLTVGQFAEPGDVAVMLALLPC